MVYGDAGLGFGGMMFVMEILCSAGVVLPCIILHCT